MFSAGTTGELLPTPSCEGAWEFDPSDSQSDWLSAEPMSSLRPYTSECSSTNQKMSMETKEK